MTPAEQLLQEIQATERQALANGRWQPDLRKCAPQL